jgi:RNA polymerase sigma-70 factor (ECF subfamily)
VQEAWLRLSRTGAADIDNLGGWLTTVVARVSLNMLRSRKARREEPLDAVQVPEPIISRPDGRRPRVRGAAGGLRRPGAARGARDALSRRAARLRAARHVRGAVRRDRPDGGPLADRRAAAGQPRAPPRARARRRCPDADLGRQREVVDAFFAAARDGDFEGLVAVLAPRRRAARRRGRRTPGHHPTTLRGARAVAERAMTFAHLHPYARPALVNGVAGVVVAPHGRPFSVMGFTVADGRIVAIDALADPERLRSLDLTILDG